MTDPFHDPEVVVERTKRVEAATQWAKTYYEQVRAQSEAVDLATELYERDRGAHASVFGSAVAMRLFLFLVPATVALSSLIGLLHLRSLMEDHLETAVGTGEVARSMSDASGWQAVSLLVTGLVLTLMAGRSLTRVLATCAVSSWRMDVHEARARPVTVLALSGILFASLGASAVLAVVRDVGGFTVTGVGEHRRRHHPGVVHRHAHPAAGVNDPGAQLPGAFAMGLGFTALQAVMHIYLPNKIARTSDTFGSLAGTVAALGNFFFIGRIMAASFVISAVAFERFGSLSQLVFGLPLVNRLPRRYRWLARFSLDADDVDAAGGPVEPVEPDER